MSCLQGEGSQLILDVLNSSSVHAEYPIVSSDKWRPQKEHATRTIENQTRQVCYLYHASKLTRTRQRNRFRYSESSTDTDSLSSDRVVSSLSLATSTLMMEFLENEDVLLNVSSEVHRVTGFLLKVSELLEDDNRLNKKIDAIAVSSVGDAVEAVRKLWSAIRASTLSSPSESLSWHHICTFLYCTYRIICKLVAREESVVTSVVNYVARFLIEQALHWIVTVGGWSSVLAVSVVSFYRPRHILFLLSQRNVQLGMVAAISVISLAYLLYRKRK